MRKFSRPIDLRSRREMTDYLRNHFRYSTMNSWNHATSYACNLKIYGLGLDRIQALRYARYPGVFAYAAGSAVSV